MEFIEVDVLYLPFNISLRIVKLFHADINRFGGASTWKFEPRLFQMECSNMSSIGSQLGISFIIDHVRARSSQPSDYSFKQRLVFFFSSDWLLLLLLASSSSFFNNQLESRCWTRDNCLPQPEPSSVSSMEALGLDPTWKIANRLKLDRLWKKVSRCNGNSLESRGKNERERERGE